MNQSSLLLTTLGILAGCALLIWGVTMLRGDSAAPAAAVDVPPVAADDHVRGLATSPVVVAEYFDFECPACGAYAPVMHQLAAEYGDRVAFVSRYFPLSQHVNGIPSALAAEAAGRQGRYWEMHDLLFARQQAWAGKTAPTPELFETFALELGLDLERFRADVADPALRARIERDFKDGQRIGVNSTPSFFLNGVPLRNPGSIEAFRALLDEALESASPVTVVGSTTSATMTVPQ